MTEDKNEILQILISSLPELPGVYQYYDSDAKLIYVGKAKNLKKRVSSYFTKNHDSGKTRILVSKIANIQHIVVETESDALLLENNLIKKYQPRYNVLLKDDKTFPWICVKNERFPRIFKTRNRIKDGSIYFGPYTSVVMVNTLLDLIKQLYKLRNCNYSLSADNIQKNKLKVCLEYHIGNCKAPCEGLQEEDDYNQSIIGIKDILKGNINNVKSYLKNLMLQFAEEQKYEDAQLIKEKLEIVEKFQSKSTIVSDTINNVDVFSILDDDKWAFVNFLKVVNGAIIQAHTVEIRKKLDETKQELFPLAILEIRQRLLSDSKEIILPFNLEFSLPDTRVIVPKMGDKKKLLDLSERNVKYYMMEKKKQESLLNPQKSSTRILETIKKDIRLSQLPVHIECFDNSNIQGTSPVASCVVFKQAKPSKRDYRHFNIKTVEGPDDFASMEEVIFRRYKRMLDENQSLPQLIVVDGGKGQLHAALKSLEKLELRGKIAIIGIAKKLEEIYFPEDSVPLYLDKNSETLKVIQHIRNEAHRFGIAFHRNQRSKKFITSQLDNIKGVGEKAKESLSKHFKTIESIKTSSIEELSKVLGESKAKLVFDFFKNQN